MSEVKPIHLPIRRDQLLLMFPSLWLWATSCIGHGVACSISCKCLSESPVINFLPFMSVKTKMIINETLALLLLTFVKCFFIKGNQILKCMVK